MLTNTVLLEMGLHKHGDYVQSSVGELGNFFQNGDAGVTIHDGTDDYIVTPAETPQELVDLAKALKIPGVHLPKDLFTKLKEAGWERVQGERYRLEKKLKVGRLVYAADVEILYYTDGYPSAYRMVLMYNPTLEKIQQLVSCLL